MIFDNLSNLKDYNIVSDEVLEFLCGADVETAQGKREFAEGVSAGVDVFYTKSAGDLEAHQKYIDIHMILNDGERIDFCDSHGLRVKTPYVHDIEFYEDPDAPLGTVYLEPGKFAVFYPGEAHKPQLHYNENASKEVRKIVVKIPV